MIFCVVASIGLIMPRRVRPDSARTEGVDPSTAAVASASPSTGASYR